MAVTEGAQAMGLEFGEVWPEVSRRLRGYLLKRGVSPHDAEDLLQTVAEKALRRDIPFESAEGLLHWCLAVVRNLDIDRWRAQSRRGEACLDQVTESAEPVWLEDRVLTRLRLARTLEALKLMRPRDRQAILMGLDSGGATSGKDRVARHRARLRLLELVGPPALVLFALGRKLTRPLTRPMVVPMAAVTTAGFAAAVIVGAGVTPIPIRDAPDTTFAVMIMTTPATTERGRAVSQSTSDPLAPAGTASGVFATGSERSQTLFVTDERGTMRVSGHDRRSQDAGLVCAHDLPVVAMLCVGPTSKPEPIPADGVTPGAGVSSDARVLEAEAARADG